MFGPSPEGLSKPQMKSVLQGDVLFSIRERVSRRWQAANITERAEQPLQLLHITGVQRSGPECLIFSLPISLF